MLPDSEAADRHVRELANKYGVTPGRIDCVTLGPVCVEPRRVVQVPPVPACEAGPHRRGPPSPLEAALLDTIHRHHLQALTMMGRDAVGLHARGMVLAGYSYGLYDPVCNILLNSLWYDAMFPATSSHALEPMMLSCKAIFRMARRSLDALVAFLRAYAPTLSAEDAMFYLNRSRGHLRRAAELVARERVHHHTNRMDNALGAAILAVHLPNDLAHEANFSFVVNSAPIDAFLSSHGILGQSLTFRLYDLASQNDASITMEEFVKSIVSTLVCTVPPPSLSILSQGAHRALRIKMQSFRRDQEFCLHIVNMALHNLAFQFGESYRIHALCGKSLVTLPPNSYYHVNFMASPERKPNEPELFFAEVCVSYKDVNDVTLCCPVQLSGKTGGCSACEFTGIKLIHPVDVEFNGQYDFTKGFDPHMVECFRKDPTSEFGVPLIDDYIFFEPDQHPEVTTFLETTYSSMSDDQVDLSLLWFENHLP